MMQQLMIPQTGGDGKPQTVYADAQFFFDRKSYLNIRIPQKVLSELDGDCQIIIRKHRNYFLKLLGLPFESVKKRRERLGQGQCMFD